MFVDRTGGEKPDHRNIKSMKKARVLILGGGFGGLYAALEFEKQRDPDIEVTLISEENFFLFTPMLHEVAASDWIERTSSIRFARCYGTSDSLRGRSNLSIFPIDESLLLTGSTSIRMRSNMTTSYSPSVA